MILFIVALCLQKFPWKESSGATEAKRLFYLNAVRRISGFNGINRCCCKIWFRNLILFREAHKLRWVPHDIRLPNHAFTNQTVWHIIMSQPLNKQRSREVGMSATCWFNCYWRDSPSSCNMMTLSNGNIFRATGHLCGEFTDPQWILRTKASDAELWCFLWSVSVK